MSKCKRPCSECAFRNDSARGYFGENSIDVYQSWYQSDVPMPCHMKSKEDGEGILVEDDSPCIGHLLAQIKSCKSPLSAESIALRAELKKQDNIEELKSQVLATWEFTPYHERDDDRVK